MKQTEEVINEKAENDILYSKTVKAGKRVYYVDVKRDRRDSYYLAITESKRVRDGNEEVHPVFEKHKIFLYHEDMGNFIKALEAAADYVRTAAEDAGRTRKVEGEAAPEEVAVEEPQAQTGEAGLSSSFLGGKIEIDMKFE